MIKLFRVAGFIGASVALFLTSSFAYASEANLSKVWEIDFSGRPPFKRKLSKLPATGDSAPPSSATRGKSRFVWRVDFFGSPPFKRRYQGSPVFNSENPAPVAAPPHQEVKSYRPRSRYKRHR